MINKIIVAGLLAFLLSGCGTTSATKDTQTLGDIMLADVLNSKPDGYVATIGSSGETYKIVSTKVSSSGSKLCRVISVETNHAFRVETYCKMKGGNWQ